MKPDAPVARRADYTVAPISHAVGADFIRTHHYARGCSKAVVHMHGLFRAGRLVGVAHWLPPTKVCAQSVHPKWQRVLSLSRLAVHPDEPQNAASLLIGGSVRHIRREGKWVALVTFADESQGHTGAIYRATNWRYVGVTKPKQRWVDAEGRQVSVLSTKSRTVQQMRALGYVVQGSFRKHKFVMALEEA